MFPRSTERGWQSQWSLQVERSKTHTPMSFLDHPTCRAGCCSGHLRSLADFYVGEYCLEQNGDRLCVHESLHHVCQILVIMAQKSH